MAENTRKTPARRRQPLRVKPVRLTVDLPPVTHRWFTDFTEDLARELGELRLGKNAVMRALIDRLAEDEELAELIKGRLADDIAQVRAERER